jgi:KaiC/GvpD/RAD55 family RecA-like ATPase
LYQTCRRSWHESSRESAIYDRLKKGPVFKKVVEHTISRKALVEDIRQLIMPVETEGFYSLIIGEHGTGKTSLMKLTVNGMDEPKGVVYADMADDEADNVDIAQVMREAIGWSPDPVIDSSQRNCCSSLLVLLKANRFAAASLHEFLRVFSRFAIKFQKEYRRLPVLIIDNVNKLDQKYPGILNLFQDYAKRSADEGIVTVVFVSSEGVPRRMMRKSIVFLFLF